MQLIPPGTATDTTTHPSWTPVRVTARLAEPVVNLDAHAAHLDGPASWGALQAYTSTHGHLTLPPMTSNHAVDFALPLASWTAHAPTPVHELAYAADPTHVWGWACSRAFYTPAGYTTVPVRRRPSTGEATRYAADKKWHLSAGPLKARDVPHQATITAEVVWYALADPAPLQELLNRVPALGRLGRHGHGRVLEWSVTPDPDASTRWKERTWPDPNGQPDGIRAPYHHLTRRMPCRP